ncbi:SDR family NAD(P)-dependent oxidoreductase [Lewinella cohaerens]|uniref:SDR family NAD(P)-dependent oxidoreductase n=1 Tax=Lewinella cohaerens TaxID=70995 RepID=UPI00047695C8
MTRIAKRCMLVTGASSGIGYATASFFVNQGWVVYGLSRSGKVPAGVKPLVADVTNGLLVQEVLAAVFATTGRLDVVVNAAGIGGASSVENIPFVEAKKIFDTNVYGTLAVMQASLPYLRQGQHTTFIAISSIAGVVGVPFHGIYSASKFAVEGLIESLRLELHGTGVTAVSVCPGDTATPIIGNQYRAKPTDLPEVYQTNYEKAERAMRESVDEGIAPLRIVETIDRIIKKSSPNPRYYVGGFIQQLAPMAKRLLPRKWFETIMKAYYGVS